MFEAKCKAVRNFLKCFGWQLWVRDTGMYLLVLYGDKQILYRPQALILCTETRAGRSKFQR